MSADAEPVTITREQLAHALSRIEVRPVGGKVAAEWMADAIITALGEPGLSVQVTYGASPRAAGEGPTP